MSAVFVLDIKRKVSLLLRSTLYTTEVELIETFPLIKVIHSGILQGNLN